MLHARDIILVGFEPVRRRNILVGKENTLDLARQRCADMASGTKVLRELRLDIGAQRLSVPRAAQRNLLEVRIAELPLGRACAKHAGEKAWHQMANGHRLSPS